MILNVSPLVRRFALCSALALAASACQDHAASNAATATQQPPDAAPAALVELLDRLSAEMARQQRDPQETIAALRALLDAEGEHARQLLRQLQTQQESLSGDPTARTQFAQRNRAALQQSLERFVASQQALRSLLNKAQKIELSLVLRNLR